MASVDELRRKYGLTSSTGSTQQTSSTQTGVNTGSTQSRSPVDELRAKYGLGETTRRNQHASQRAETPAPKRASSTPVVPEAEQRRQSERQTASTNRANARTSYTDLRNTRDSIKAKADDMMAEYDQKISAGASKEELADEYAKIMKQYGLVTDYDKQVEDAYAALKQADKEYKDVYAGYNAARQEVKAAQRNLRDVESQYAGWATDDLSAQNIGQAMNNAEDVKAARTRLANAREAYIEQGGNPDANIIGSNAKNWAGQMLGTARYMQDLHTPGNEINVGPFSFGRSTIQGVPEEVQRQAVQAQARRTEETAARLQRESAEEINSMKAGRSELGQFGIDVAGQGVQMGLDAATGKILPGGSLTAMALRTFGSSAQEAKDAGATLTQQGLYGAGTAAVEVLTEKMFDGLAGIYGAGAADDIVSHAIGRFTQNRLGQAALGMVADAAGEGLEEVISDLANPVLRSIYDEHVFDNGYFSALNGEEILYDFLVGAAMGMVGGSVEGVTKATGIAAEDERSKFFMQAGQDGVKIGDAMRLWQRHLIKEGYATQTGDQNISNRAGELEKSIDDKKFDPFREQKINRLNQQAASTVAREDMRNTLGAVEQRMQQLGEENSELAEAITMVALEGEAERIGARDSFATRNIGSVTATEAQHRMVEASPIAQRILSEMDVENLRGEQQAEAFNTFAAQMGASDEELQRNLEPYQRSNEWVKKLQGNKALAADVYGTQATVTAEEKASVKVNGEAAKIVGAKDGKAIVEQNGERKTVDLDEIEGIGKGYRQLVTAAANGTSGEAMLRLYNPGQNVDAYAKAWNLAENVYGAQTNISYEEARGKGLLRELTDNQLKSALELGRERYDAKQTQAKERSEQFKTAREKAKKQGTVQRKKGTVSYDGGEINGIKYKGADRSKFTRQQKKVAAMVEAMADAVNLDYMIVEGEKNTGGCYIKGGVVVININSGTLSGKTLGAATLSHELTHHLQDYAPEQYQELKDFIVADILKQSPEQFNRMVQRQLALEPNLSYDQATDELIANACQTMLLNSKAVEKLARQNMTLAERITDWISETAEKIKAAFEDVDLNDNISIYEPARAIAGVMDEVQELWDKALLAANENYNAEQATGKKNTAENGGVQYLKTGDKQSKSIKEQIADHSEELNAKAVVTSIRVSDMPKGDIQKQRRWAENRLKNTGYAVDRKGTGRIEFTPSQLNTGLNYLDEPGEIAAFAALPAVLKRGDIIDQHDEHKGRQRGSMTIAAPVEINGVRGNMAVALTETTSRHYHAHRIVMPDGSTFVFNENEDAESKPVGELPAKQALIAEPINSTSDNNIAQRRSESNTQNQQFQMFDSSGKEMTDGQKEYFADSKIRDREGRLKVMYRGGASDITVFDRRKSSYSNLYGRGFYFTDSESHASQYGKAHPYYLNITNPLQAGAKTFTNKQIRAFLEAVAEDEDYGLENYGYGATVSSVMKELKGKDDFGVLSDINATCIGDLVAASELFNEVNGTNIDGIVTPTETVAFRSDQIKEIDNENPTRNPDTRFQMFENTEETDKLVAVHNKSVSGLRRMLQRGGVPFPSIAIKKAGAPHEGFGDISIVFPRSTIDPQVNRQNRLYSNDAWTPTEPRTEFEVDVPWKLKQKLEDIVGKDIFKDLNGYGNLDDDEVAKALADSTGNIFEALKKRNVIKYAYLKSIGQAPEVTQREADLDGSHKYKNAQLLYVFDHVPAEEINAANWESKDTLQKIADALNEQFESSITSDQGRAFRKKYGKLYTADDINIGYIKSALFKYQQNGNSTGTETDTNALSRALMDNTAVENDPDFKKWIEDTFNGVVKNSGIPNGKDPYTSSGNRRSFKQTHMPATLENIVAQMQKQNEKGIGLFGVNLRGAATKTYSTVEQMRADTGKLLGEHISDDVYKSYMDGFHGRLHNITSQASQSERWESMDSTEQILLETLRDANSKAQMGRMLDREAKWIKLYPELTDELWQLKQDVQNMPAPYFEAKPRRIVYPEEALAYILPDNADADVLQALEQRGYNVLTYKAGDSEDRLAKLNSVEGAQFQKWGIGETEAEQQERKESFDAIKAQNKILKARAEYWRGQTRQTKENTVRQQDTDRLANELLREYESKTDKAEVKAVLKELGDWLVRQNGESLSYDELYRRARSIAEDVIDGNYSLLDNSRQEDLNRLKDFLKGTAMNISASDWRDTGDEGFRKKYGRYFTVSENGRSLDSAWGELEAMFGEGVFPEDVYAPGDMLNMIADYLDMWKPQYGNEFEQNRGEAVEWATGEIIDRMLSEEVRQTPATYADKAQQKLNAQIARDKEKLDTLRAQKNARIEQIRRQAAEKNKQIRIAEKAAKYEATAKVKQHYLDMLQRQRNRRSDTNVRGKIKALHKELTDMLLKPKEGRYVPKDLVKATAEILGAVDTTSGRAAKAKAALAQLKVQYDALAQDPKYSLTYDETVSGMLQEITKELGEGSIYDLTGSELEGVYNVLKALKHTIQTANKLVGAQIEADAFEAANQMMRETENAKGIPTKALRKFVMAQMTPASFFRMAGGYVKNSMWEQMFGELNRGQLTQTQVLMEGGQIFRELIDDKKNLDTLHDQKNLVDIGLKDDLGNSIKITRGMMLSVYMHLQNEQNARHISYGGMTVPRLKQYYKNQMADAFNGKTGRAVAFATEIAELNQQLSEAETEQEREEIQDKIAELQDQTDAYMSNLRAQIEKQLTEYDRKWIAAAQQFFDEYSKNKLNEVTEMVYGFSKAQVDHYFPIHTDANYRAASFDTIVRDMSLENAGFMKERINGANPILLEDITDVISSQLRRTAQYVGLMPAIRNFNKAYGKARAGYSMSVQSAMAQTFENEGKKYIENLMADLNGARKTEANIFDELRGNMAGAVLTFNPRVTLAQAASFPSAAAEIGYTPLMKALTDMKNPMWDKGLQDEIAKWTPLWWYRMQGYSTTELGDIKNNEQFMAKVMDKMKWATGWIQAADGLTTGGLWQASKYYVDENFSDLQKGSDEYMMKVAEVYNRVLEKTQPDYTTMQRPDILRNPNAIVKQLTMFMTQRLQNMNILYDAAATYSHYVRDMDKGRNGVTAADVQQAKTRLIWAVSSQVAASATIVIFKALADALMHSMDAYRDDDDELTAESVSKTMLTNFAETISGNILWGSEAFSWLKSALTGERYYGVSLNGVDTFTDMLSDGNKLIQKLVKGDLKDAGAPAWKLTKAVAQFFGASLGNAEKFVKMIANNIEDAANGDWFKFEAGVDRTKAQNTHLLFDALQAGDTARATRLKENFKDEKDVRASLKSYIKELYTGEDQQILKDETIKLLQQYCGMTRRDAESTAQEWTMEIRTGIKYSDLNSEFIEGNVDRAHAIKYLQDYKSMTRAEAEAKVLEWQCEKDTGIAFADIGTEVKTGRIGKTKALAMVMKYGGKSEEAADKQVEGWLIEHEYNIKPSELQEEYMDGNVSVEDAFDILVRYKYNGKEDAEEKAYNELVRWNFIEENPGTEDITVTQIQRYQNSGLEGVVDGKSYLDAYEATSIMHGVDTDGDGKANRYTRVDQQLAYIDGMDLTSEQKTSLALALGINEKSIRNRAPWNKRR